MSAAQSDQWIADLFFSGPAVIETAPVTVPTAPAKPKDRHYVRCHDCLSIVVIDRDPRQLTTFDRDGTRHEALCSLCNGPITYMGAVKSSGPASWLTVSQTVCKCSEDCISARGPICTCKCGAQNHGVGLMAGYMTIQTPAGPVPTVAMPDSAKARAVALAWREALATFDLEYRPLATAYGARVWLARDQFERYVRLRDIRSRAREMTSQAGRLRVLASR
jgi:hypothetical protein